MQVNYAAYFLKDRPVPPLFLAPMEGLGDRCFRGAIASIGGFDEAVTEFISVPSNAHVKSLASRFDPHELGQVPIAAQIMGVDEHLMGAMADQLEKLGAPRIDLNCGCPSNTVTGRGAGSSLLKTPDLLYQIARSMVRSCTVPVSVKMRIGYDDPSLFQENLKAVEESGAVFLTLHPRTKVDGYTPPARWEYIAEAKASVKIPVIGNGDILTARDAERMIRQTGADALMVGRGSVIDPFIFQKIRAHFEGREFQGTFDALERFIDIYEGLIHRESPLKNRLNKLKQLFSMLYKKNSALMERRNRMLTSQATTMQALIALAKEDLSRYFFLENEG